MTEHKGPHTIMFFSPRNCHTECTSFSSYIALCISSLNTPTDEKYSSEWLEWIKLLECETHALVCSVRPHYGDSVNSRIKCQSVVHSFIIIRSTVVWEKARSVNVRSSWWCIHPKTTTYRKETALGRKYLVRQLLVSRYSKVIHGETL